MVRSISDNPGGWNRTLPTHAVEFDANYAAPWVDAGDVVIASGATGVHTLTLPDDDMIYFVDMISITPKAYTAFSSYVSLNNVQYLYVSQTGWVNIPLSQNPSLQFVYGDHIDVSVINLDASQRTFAVYLNGTKIPMPPGYTHGDF